LIQARERLAEAAVQKKADLERRMKAKDEERAALAATKAEETRKRKDLKETNKRKALVNRMNMVTQKQRNLSTRLNTNRVLAQYNNSLTEQYINSRQSLLAGQPSAELLDPSLVVNDA
jgi:hypothetical protein